MYLDRRKFLTTAATFSSGAFLVGCGKQSDENDEASGPIPDDGSRYKISLAQWSLHRALKGGELDNLDFPSYTKETFGINAIEWVNQFFGTADGKLGYQPIGQNYLNEMKKRCDDNGVRSLLIMCDRVGQLGDPDAEKRANAIEGHYAWLDAAKFLGCHSIRVNAASDPSKSPEEQADLCSDGLRRLSEHAAPMGLNVIVENHGGLSSNGYWLAKVMENVGLDNCGTLPDFGNFYVAKNRGKADVYAKQKAVYADDPAYKEDEFGVYYDRYKGLWELLPWAKGISAKAHDFDENGNEIHTDFERAMTIINETDYKGYIGIEYEGKELGEIEGIKKTKALLEKTFAKLA